MIRSSNHVMCVACSNTSMSFDIVRATNACFAFFVSEFSGFNDGPLESRHCRYHHSNVYNSCIVRFAATHSSQSVRQYDALVRMSGGQQRILSLRQRAMRQTQNTCVRTYSNHGVGEHQTLDCVRRNGRNLTGLGAVLHRGPANGVDHGVDNREIL